MKTYKKILIMLAAPLWAFTACEDFGADDHKFANSVYLDVSTLDQVQPTTFNNITPSFDRPITAMLAYPSDSEVTVGIEVDASLVESYNVRYGTSWQMLPKDYYELSATSATIPAGKAFGRSVTLHFKGLMGEGEAQTGALTIDQTYLLPVRITSSSLAIMEGSSVAYYVVKRSSAITTAGQLSSNWITFPSLDVYSPTSAVFNGLTAVTYEALIYIDEFVRSGISGAVSISSIMGVEQYLLLRIGDTNFEREQLQFDGSGDGATFGKFPTRDSNKLLLTGRWYHVACTYDQNAREVKIYVDGRVQSQTRGVGIASPSEANRINLAMRAAYNRWETASAAEKPALEELSYHAWSAAYQFFIGKSYDDYRPLNGKIAEARVWSVARTEQQIRANMYNVKNPKDDATLLGYWKFNEGKGNVVNDSSRYGNHGVPDSPMVWANSIEIPVINFEEE